MHNGETDDTGETVILKVLTLDEQELPKNLNEESEGDDHDNAAPDGDGTQSESEE